MEQSYRVYVPRGPSSTRAWREVFAEIVGGRVQATRKNPEGRDVSDSNHFYFYGPKGLFLAWVEREHRYAILRRLTLRHAVILRLRFTGARVEAEDMEYIEQNWPEHMSAMQRREFEFRPEHAASVK